MRRDPRTVLRSLALLAPLGAPFALAGCARTQGNNGSPESSSATLSAASCPSAAPVSDSPCAPALLRCDYRADNQRCLCAAEGRWQCMSMVPTRGPLPPPDLPATLTPSEDRA